MRKIIVNNLFVGSFGFDESNIPTEVINFYQADKADTDEDNCYVYLAPRGQLGVDNEKEVEAILFVRTAYTGVVEVIGKTGKIIDSYVKGLQYKNKDGKKVKYMPRKQSEAITSVKYGGHTLKDIFSLNSTGESVYVSCKVEGLYVPTKTFFIAMNRKYANKAMLSDANCIVMSDEEENERISKEDNEAIKKINNQSMKVIYDEQEVSEQYDKINEIIKKSDLWKKLSDEDQYTNSINKIIDDDNIFRAIRRQDDEVVFSSILHYFLSKYKATILPMFAKEVLNLSVIVNNNTVVAREKQRMDISVITDDMFIIIENKIKSGVNGIKDRISETEKIESQLSKYYQIAENYNSAKNREIRCYILHPEYNHLNLNDFEKGNKYCKISYKKLYNFFGKIIDINKEDKIIEDTDSYYAEQFYKALYKHTTETDCSYRNELLKRLKRRIVEIEQGKTS